MTATINHIPWAFGKPDLILECEEYELGPHGPDEYRCFVLPTDLRVGTGLDAKINEISHSTQGVGVHASQPIMGQITNHTNR